MNQMLSTNIEPINLHYCFFFISIRFGSCKLRYLYIIILLLPSARNLFLAKLHGTSRSGFVYAINKLINKHPF